MKKLKKISLFECSFKSKQIRHIIDTDTGQKIEETLVSFNLNKNTFLEQNSFRYIFNDAYINSRIELQIFTSISDEGLFELSKYFMFKIDFDYVKSVLIEFRNNQPK